MHRLAQSPVGLFSCRCFFLTFICLIRQVTIREQAHRFWILSDQHGNRPQGQHKYQRPKHQPSVLPASIFNDQTSEEWECNHAQRVGHEQHAGGFTPFFDEPPRHHNRTTDVQWAGKEDAPSSIGQVERDGSCGPGQRHGGEAQGYDTHRKYHPGSVPIQGPAGYWRRHHRHQATKARRPGD